MPTHPENKTLGPAKNRSGSATTNGSLAHLAAESNPSLKDEMHSRRRAFRNALGQTKKSPLLWSVTPSSMIVDQVQEMHNAFVSKRLPSNSAIAQLPQSPAPGRPAARLQRYEELLIEIAFSAYRQSQQNESPSQPRTAGKIPAVHPENHFESVAGSNGSETNGSEVSARLSSLLHQLQHVELPLWNLFPELKSAKRKTGAIIQELETLITTILDPDGWLQTSDSAELGLLTASWCRCHTILQGTGFKLHSEVQSRLDGICLQIARFLRPDGSLLLGDFGGGLNSNAFRSALLDLNLNRRNRRLLEFCFQKSVRASKKKDISEFKGRMPAASSISEWAQAGVLQTGWLPGRPKVGLNFDRSEFRMEICQRSAWISGTCMPTVRIDGRVKTATSGIEVICDLHFDQSDFVELEIEFGEWTLHRQILLLRDDDLLWIGDNLTGPKSKQIEYRCGYPLGPGVEWVAESENTELYLRQKKSFCLVLPLALPEWKSALLPGRLGIHDGQLALSQTINGMGLSAPLVFDLNPKRSTKPRTWRRLCVAEKMETVGPDIAAAYRIQIGREQWLFYRSIADKGNRTFLGENFAGDFFAGRINLNGTVSTILEVE